MLTGISTVVMIPTSNHLVQWPEISSFLQPQPRSAAVVVPMTKSRLRSLGVAWSQLPLVWRQYQPNPLQVAARLNAAPFKSNLVKRALFLGDSRSRLTGLASKFGTIRCRPPDHALSHAVCPTRAMLKLGPFCQECGHRRVLSAGRVIEYHCPNILSPTRQHSVRGVEQSTDYPPEQLRNSLDLWLCGLHGEDLWTKVRRNLRSIYN